MKSRLMTLSADPGIGDFEEAVIDRTMGLVTIGAIFHYRGMLPEKGPAPLRMALVAGLIDARPFELRGIGSSMGVVAIGACHLAFSERHVRRAHELGSPLKVTLAADFCLGSLVEERSFLTDLGQLKTVARLFHDRVAVDAGDSAARMRARFPVGLNPFLMALETGLVLGLNGHFGILPKSDQPADAPASPGSYVVAAGAMAIFTGLSFKPASGIEEEDLTHHGFREFVELSHMAGFADLTTNIGSFWGGRDFSGPESCLRAEKEGEKQNRCERLFHRPIIFYRDSVCMLQDPGSADR